MNKVILPIALITCATLAHAESSTIINGLDFGPLAQLAGTWKSTDAGGVDVAPGQEGSKVGKGGRQWNPFTKSLLLNRQPMLKMPANNIW
ncbi:hypothetical protein [Aeromonas veronii]